jgi:hypothetical protein
MNPAAVLRSSARALKELLLENSLEFLPARRVWRQYSWARLRRDAVAGLNVALLAVAQGLAFAAMAGVPIAHGLTCAAVASLVGPLLSSSRHTILGPTNATAFLVFSGMTLLPAADREEMLPVIIFMAGAMLVVAAYCRLADLLQYVSRSVVVGYLAGCALLIMANQLAPVLGCRPPAEPPLSPGWSPGWSPAYPRCSGRPWSFRPSRWRAFRSAPSMAAAPDVCARVWPRARPPGCCWRAGRWMSTPCRPSPRDLVPAMPDLSDPSVWGRLSPLIGLARSPSPLSPRSKAP